MPKVIFIRHAESSVTAEGIPTDFASIPLTEKGVQQACEFAARWKEAPALIVTSPFLRARDSAKPTCERFADVQVEEWPVEEFSFLRTDRWQGATFQQLWAAGDEFWRQEDPEYCDGPGAESFAAFLRRIKNVLARLRGRSEPLILVFTHGHVIQAVRMLLEHSGLSDRQLRFLFLQRLAGSPIANCETFTVDLS